MRPVVAVVPDGRRTAVVARDGRDLVGWQVVRRRDGGPLPPSAYLAEVLEAVEVALAELPVPGLAVMQLRPRHPAAVWNSTGAMGTAQVAGAIVGEFGIARHGDLVLVARKVYGCRTDSDYPRQLSGRRERAAWDVAGVGALALDRRKELVHA